jgi:hypothetical protein
LLVADVIGALAAFAAPCADFTDVDARAGFAQTSNG